MAIQEVRGSVSFQEEAENGHIHISLPFSDLDKWVPDNNSHSYNQTLDSFPVDRLTGVHQLGFLSWIHSCPPEKQYFMNFHHDRYDHTLAVAMVMETILKQNGFSEKDIEKGLTAAFLHDITTPAGGNAIMELDYEKLDEEASWFECLDSKGLNFLAEKGIKLDEIDSIIKNRGLLGKILDISDRIAYVMKDLYAVGDKESIVVVDKDEDGKYKEPEEDSNMRELSSVRSSFPDIGNIYKDVCCDKETGEVYFSNPQRLAAFLKIRALLYKNLYLHPINRGRDLAMRLLARPFYSRDNKNKEGLNPKNLRKMTDEKLLEYLSLKYEFPFKTTSSLYESFVSWYPEYEEFSTLAEAEERMEKLNSENGNLLMIGIHEVKYFNPGTSYPIKDANGNLVPFKDFDPENAGEIEEIMGSAKKVYLFYDDLSLGKFGNLRGILKI